MPLHYGARSCETAREIIFNHALFRFDGRTPILPRLLQTLVANSHTDGRTMQVRIDEILTARLKLMKQREENTLQSSLSTS
jgi:hypothetical protein